MLEARFEILSRLYESQDHKCAYCSLEMELMRGGALPDTPQRATIDHVVARRYRGPDNEDNMVAACDRCNHLKDRQKASKFSKSLQELLTLLPDRSMWHSMSDIQFQDFLEENWLPKKRIIQRRAEREAQKMLLKSAQGRKLAKTDREIAFQIMEKMRRDGRL